MNFYQLKRQKDSAFSHDRFFKGSECWGFIKLLDEIWNIKDSDIERVRKIVEEDCRGLFW